MAKRDFDAVIRGCNGSLRELNREERWSAMQAWREIFASRLFAATGKWKLGDYEWHVFSFNHAPALNGQKAEAMYFGQPAAAIYVVPEDVAWSAFRCEVEQLPDLRAVLDDVYVWTEDSSWTMAFTHEQDAGFGPYFCRREWL